MNEGIQKEFEMLGKYGCGFLCLCHFFKVPESEVLFYFRLAKKKGIMDTDCFVNDWGKLASLMADEWESFRCEKSNLKDKKAVFCMEYWYNPRTKLHHFKLKDFDPLGGSVTVKEGMIESYRNFYRK